MDVLVVCTMRPEDAELVSLLMFESGATAVGVHELEDLIDGRGEPLTELHAGFASEQIAAGAIEVVKGRAECRIERRESLWVFSQREGLDPAQIGPWSIRAPWHSPITPNDLIIDPGAAFGHGSHPSTALVLDLLPGIVGAEDHVLDVGTGTGVLAIASARLGATATAIDNDPEAIEVARANAATNGVSHHIAFAEIDVATSEPLAGDVALSNLTAAVQRRVAPQLQEVATIVLSGLLEHQSNEMAALYPAHDRIDESSLGEWVAVVLSR